MSSKNCIDIKTCCVSGSIVICERSCRLYQLLQFGKLYGSCIYRRAAHIDSAMASSEQFVWCYRSKSRSVDHGFSPPFDLDSLRSKVEGRFEAVQNDFGKSNDGIIIIIILMVTGSYRRKHVQTPTSLLNIEVVARIKILLIPAK
jgi:hypothetical protein